MSAFLFFVSSALVGIGCQCAGACSHEPLVLPAESEYAAAWKADLSSFGLHSWLHPCSTTPFYRLCTVFDFFFCLGRLRRHYRICRRNVKSCTETVKTALSSAQGGKSHMLVPVQCLDCLTPVGWMPQCSRLEPAHVSSSTCRTSPSPQEPGAQVFQFWAATLAPSLEHYGIRKVSLAVCLHWPGPRRWDSTPCSRTPSWH